MVVLSLALCDAFCVQLTKLKNQPKFEDMTVSYRLTFTSALGIKLCSSSTG